MEIVQENNETMHRYCFIVYVINWNKANWSFYWSKINITDFS